MPPKLLKINIQNKLNIYDGTDGTVTSFTLVNIQTNISTTDISHLFNEKINNMHYK